MLKLIADNYEIAVDNDGTYTPGSADNQHKYNYAYHLGLNSYVTSQHSIRVTGEDRDATSCILTAGGGASGIHEHSAIILDSACFIAVGPFIASLSLPTLELIWSTQTDEATCFGIYKPPTHNCLISHGELLIARLGLSGTIIWQAGGADIFTNGFTVHTNSIEAVDFYDRRYFFDIETGREIAA